ncbi:MAG: MerR family transcriptional regulator [Taibaiella sp.]|nr:MerR family transcriptional regulator [Taibaiella sp.]
MSERILTLFGEELLPEPPKPPVKARAKKKNGAQDEGQDPENLETEGEGDDAETALAQPVGAASPDTGPEAPENNVATAEPEAPPSKTKKPKNKREDDDTLPKPETLPDDWKGEKQYYTIGEVAELFKVNTSHIRFWTTEFKMNVRTTRKGDRLYTPAQIKEIKAIHHLVKERRFTLDGAKTKLKANKNREVQTLDLGESLTELRARLVAMKNQLNKNA